MFSRLSEGIKKRGENMKHYNIIYILESNGYDVLEETDMRYFKLKFNKKELEKRLEEKDLYNFDLESVFNVEIEEVGFNGYGNLYIELRCTGGDDPVFVVGDCFDVIEYS